MANLRRLHTCLTWSLRFLLCAVCAPTVQAQNQAQSQPEPSEPLRAEISGARAIYNPHQPIRVRFAIVNQSDATVEIPLTRPPKENGGIALPTELIVGSSDEPALLVVYEDEKPVPVRPDSPASEEQPGSAVLRLAGGGSVGAEIDLRELYRRIRYSGVYRLEWRPLGGRLGTATVQFRVEPRKDAILVTDYGKVTFALMYDQAPLNVENFLDLVRSEFYRDKTLHRIIAGFLIQGGCPQGDGTGVRPDGKLIPAEFHNTPFELGTLAMARKPDKPNTASCQFFITLARLEELDGQYTVIGQARDDESLRTLQQLASIATDEKHRPLRPVLIRSFSLVDAEATEHNREIQTPRP